jgi:protocatechuate 3,4-dioxygenase beta subunit
MQQGARKMSMNQVRGRRRFLITGSAAVAGLTFARRDSGVAQPLALTPECKDGDEPTPRQTEGPFFKPSSPERADLVEPGMAGRRLDVSGLVLDRNCKPVARALIDVWQADAKGAYDNQGFRLRGHVFSDAEGRYRIRAIRPASYPGRTAHIHVKAQAPGGRILTTQLYFPDEAGNRHDPLFRRELLVQIVQAGETLSARFDFVLDTR